MIESTPKAPSVTLAGEREPESDSGWSTVAMLASEPDPKTVPEAVQAVVEAIASPAPEVAVSAEPAVAAPEVAEWVHHGGRGN